MDLLEQPAVILAYQARPAPDAEGRRSNSYSNRSIGSAPTFSAECPRDLPAQSTAECLSAYAPVAICGSKQQLALQVAFQQLDARPHLPLKAEFTQQRQPPAHAQPL